MGFFPLLDFALHGDTKNVKCIFDAKIKALRVVATRRIQPGGEVLNGYIEDGTHTNWQLLHNWGFVLERSGATRKYVQIKVDPTIKGADLTRRKRGLLAQAHELPRDTEQLPPAVFGLSQLAEDPSSYRFLGHLRFLTDDRDLRGEARPEKVPVLPPTDWRREHLALRVAQRVLTRALRAYPDTLKQDRELLRMEDKRLSTRRLFMTILRRDEKETLLWWSDFVRKAISKSPADETPVDIKYMKKLWVDRQREKGFSLMRQIKSDFADAVHQPRELLLLIGGLFAALDLAAYAGSHALFAVTHSARFSWPSVVLRWWKQIFGTLAAVAALCKPDVLRHVAYQRHNVIIPVACIMHVLVRRVRLKITEPDPLKHYYKCAQEGAAVRPESHVNVSKGDQDRTHFRSEASGAGRASDS